MNRFGQRPRPKRSRAGNDSRKMHPRPDPTRNNHGQSTARFNPLPCPQEPSPPSAKYAPCLDSYPSSPRSVSCEHPPTHRSAPLVSEISGAAGPEGVNRWPRLTEQLALRDRPSRPVYRSAALESLVVRTLGGRCAHGAVDPAARPDSRHVRRRGLSRDCPLFYAASPAGLASTAARRLLVS